MAVEALGNINTAVTNALPKSVVNQDEFLKILLTQLQFQDPLKPLDNQEFIAQLAQFTNLEQTRQLDDGVNTLLTIQSSTQSIGLIGKTVDVAGANGGSATGTVTTVSFASGQPRLTVKTADGAFVTDVSLAQIALVR
jgi:flagellar basal-body rod modification protein FlgD